MSAATPAPGSWLASAPPESAPQAAALRLLPLRCARAGNGEIWLCACGSEPAPDVLLRTIPGLQLWDMLENGGLRRSGDLLPTRSLPSGLNWQPIRDCFAAPLPVASFTDELPAPAAIMLVPGGAERPAAVLTTSLSDLAAWAETAAEVRLARLTFAASSDGRAIVCGTPLPPLPGEYWYAEQGVAAPCGWTWQPAVYPAAMRLAAKAPEGSLLMLTPQGMRLILAEQFIPATRASLRATAEEL